MRRFVLFTLGLAVSIPAFAADSAVLLRVERRTPGDLAELRAAGMPVVMEQQTCLLVEGPSKDASWLEAHGWQTRVLDTDAARSDFLVVGLRPDSDRAAVEALGPVLLAEANWVLVRVAPGTPIEWLHAARVFVTRLPHTPVAAPLRTELSPSPPRGAIDLAGDPLVQQMVNQVSPAQIDLLWADLTTNAPTGTRYTQSQGCRDASTYCYNRYAAYRVPAQYQNWSASDAPNVIGTQEGAINPGNVYIVIGHLDDLPTSGVAPGADDNASGSVNVLESARIMSCYAFRNTVKYINCTGEESGLYGSKAYADDAAVRGENILGVINMDMPGWQGNGIPNPENLDVNYNDASTDLGQRFAAAATTYGTGLVVDAFLCPSLTASDHYSFWTHGWKAICGITDNEDYCGHAGNYPYYHTSNDTIANCGNKSFFYSAVKTSVATLAELAQPFKIAFDRSAIACQGGTLTIYVGDRDLNTNPSLVETLLVNVTSGTEATPETVVLTEKSADSMIFSGTVQTTSGPPVQGDGKISVSAGDTVTATYTDALDCNGATGVTYQTSAQADCVAPVISGVAATGVTGNSATIIWTTDEASTSVVHYGLAAPGAATASSVTRVTAHSVPLTGLTECSTYYYWVESADAAGNVASDTRGGAYYTFDTGKNTNPNYTSTDTPLAIPDNNTTGATSTISVTDNNTVLDVNVTVNLTHTYDGDLTLSLIAPSGATITLSSARGGSGDNFRGTVFDDEAASAISTGAAPFTGSFRPETPLSAADGINAAGAWKLKVVDSASTDTGTIDNWTLALTYPAAACGPHAIYQSYSETDACMTGGTGSANSVIDRGEDVTLPVSIRNDGTTTLTGVTGRLTTTTPDVHVARATASFPDLPVGATATTLAPHFGFTVGPGVACGTDIAFNLAIRTNQGTFPGAFTVKVGAESSTTTNFASADVPKPIPDNNATGATSNVTVSNTGTVQDVNVTANIVHTWDGDITLSLVGPNGTTITLSAKRGSSGDNYTNTVFDDAAATSITSGSPPFTGTFRPESPLSAFNGIPANGVWGLKVVDSASSDTGTITGWTLQLKMASGWACKDCVLAAPTGEPVQQAWVDRTGLQWEPIANTAYYSVYRGASADLPKLMTSAVDSCLTVTCETNATGPALLEAPAPSDVFWYLVRAGNGGGEGPAGSATAGPRVQNSSGACP